MPSAPEPAAAAGSDDIVVRECASTRDYVAVYALQVETWGASTVLVPTPILKVGQRIGGVTAGAFDASGELLGFVFGLTGPQGGRLVHWSDMLAVREDARDRGIGQRLKAFQRARCREIGAAAIQWTYDPLVARNAHLNLMKLGAWPVEYVTDMYGDSDSPLHAGFGTDRFVVEWPVDPAATVTGAEVRMDFGLRPDGSRTMPLLTDGTTVDLSPVAQGAAFGLVAIPRDIHAIAAADLDAARRWRAATREALVGAMDAGYRVVGVFRDIPPDGITAYVVLRGDLAAAAFAPAGA